MNEIGAQELEGHSTVDRRELRDEGEKWSQFHLLNRLQNILAFLVAALVLLAVIMIVYWAINPDMSPTWTGFGAYNEEAQGARARTLWDWLDLLIVPAILGFAAYWLNSSQKKTELKISEDQRREERSIAKEQRKVDLRIAQTRQHQTTLEGYFDRMTELLLDHELRGKLTENDEERSIARARTLAVLRSLSKAPVHKGQVVRFLHEAMLIRAPIGEPNSHDAVLLLEGADLSHADLRGADLKGTDMSEANLRKAHLQGVNLQQAKLRGTNLEGARMEGTETNLSEADFTGANLVDAHLEGAQLMLAKLFQANLSSATLTGARMDAADLRHADLKNGAKLEKVSLQVAQLDMANLTDAILVFANLSGATLTGAILCGADLSGAKLSEVVMTQARYDANTKWPEQFNPETAGCIEVLIQ